MTLAYRGTLRRMGSDRPGCWSLSGAFPCGGCKGEDGWVAEEVGTHEGLAADVEGALDGD